ncbi:MAG: hypothetical protein RIT43_924 [Bacteroidota bacterium]
MKSLWSYKRGSEQNLMWRKVYLLSATFLLVILASSCKKKESSVGSNILDPNELLGSSQIDTFQLTTFTYEEDSLISDNPAYAVLGSYNDPKFGTVNANFYTQVRLAGLNPDFGDPLTISVDSVMLGLEYAGFYGEFSSQTVEVYELNESLSIDSTYYSFTTKSVKSTNLVEPGFGTFTPNPDAITVIGTDTVDTQLRIKLRKSLGEQIINDATNNPSAFSSVENFLEYFKGVHVKVNNPAQFSGKGGVFYFNINDPLSKITIYYTQDGEQKTFDLLINTECADFNHVDVNNSGKPVQTVINDTVSGQQEFYSQAFKSRAIVKIPGMKSIPSNAIIHKAELILPIQYQTGAKYLPPDELSVAVKVDGTLSGIGVLGLYDYAYKHYTIDIRNYLQALVTNQISTDELILSPRMFITSADRVIFNGPNTINKKKPKLVVTYTTY